MKCITKLLFKKSARISEVITSESKNINHIFFRDNKATLGNEDIFWKSH